MAFHNFGIQQDLVDTISFFGIDIDAEKNAAATHGEMEIGKDGSAVRVFVIPTNEEMVIAREAERLVGV